MRLKLQLITSNIEYMNNSHFVEIGFTHEELEAIQSKNEELANLDYAKEFKKKKNTKNIDKDLILPAKLTDLQLKDIRESLDDALLAQGLKFNDDLQDVPIFITNANT